MLLAINGVEKYPCVMEPLGVLHELGIGSGGGPDRAAIDVIAVSAQ